MLIYLGLGLIFVTLHFIIYKNEIRKTYLNSSVFIMTNESEIVYKIIISIAFLISLIIWPISLILLFKKK